VAQATRISAREDLSLDPGDAGFRAERTLLDFLLATVEG
jgi:hypothetical protein